MLTVNHVTKKYGSFTALENISIEFEQGLYGLLAPNGAGKTTLMKMITTLLYPTNGEILYQGDDIIDLDSSYRDIIGYLPQHFGYYKNYSPKQLLQYIGVLKGIERSVLDERIEYLLDTVSLSDVADKKMKKFSGGMIQRVGIAQAMLNDPKILILDEPTAGLDPKERVKFRNLISMLSEKRIVILSTHIVSDLETIANNVIMIKDHEIACNDTPQKICARLKGKVFETVEDHLLPDDHLVLTRRQEGENRLIRFFSEKNQTGGSSVRQAIPTLEDVFLYVYRDICEI